MLIKIFKRLIYKNTVYVIKSLLYLFVFTFIHLFFFEIFLVRNVYAKCV